MMTVELLGPLRVSVAGHPVELPAGRLRALLAVLAMSAGRAVPADRLATAVWGIDSRGDLSANVRTNVRRLRRALGAAGGQLIAARPGGYLLAAEPDRVDALRFGRLLDEAAAAPDPAAERSMLAAALALWRGTPFDGIRSDWLDLSVAPALEERYLTALEWRVDLDLAKRSRPGPGDLVRLAELAERHPLRESLWVRLLRVLESADRSAEALQRYETIRRRLAEELGADPSPGLRQVHTDLLTRGALAEGRVAPRQLPSAVSGFAGRKAELAALDALLGQPDEARPQAPVIAGMAGVGKTTLAVHWAHRVAGRYPDGQLYVNLRGYDPSGQAVQPADVIRDFLDALRVPPHQIPVGPAARAGLYRSVLAGRRMLVLLDNARDAGQVAPLLPGTPGCLVVVTSRDHLPGLVMTFGAHPFPLGLLSPEDAGRLLARRIGEDRVSTDPAAAAKIVDRCGGLPLALAIAAARAAIHPAHPLSALAGELQDTLAMLDRTAEIRAIFSWSYQTLSAEAARLFRLVAGLHPGADVATGAAASVAGVLVSRARALLAELTHASLLTEHAPGRYSCHDLLRAYARELCGTSDPDTDAALHRMADHYAHTAHAAARHLHVDVSQASMCAAPGPSVAVAEFDGPGEALAWLTAERPALLATLRVAADLGLDRQVCQLAQAMFVFLHRQGFWHDQADTQRTAVAAARRLGDPAEQARAHRSLGRALADLGCFDKPHRNLDIALERSHDDPAGQAWTHYFRDHTYVIQGREADALGAARRAHDLFDQLGDQAGLAITLTDLGWYHGRLGDHGQALNLCEQALALHHKLGNRPHEAHTWSCLAETHLRLGDPASAVPCYRQALDLFREIGDVYGQISTVAHLGACHYLADDKAAGREQWRHAHACLGELDQFTTAQIHAQLAVIDKSAADAFRRRG